MSFDVHGAHLESGTSNVVEDFIGCYLLVSRSTIPHYKNRTYIGFTNDPNRRIKQHNKGHQAGGASKTDNRGPWDMILIVHGFPNSISGLRFEWAWQHPESSRRLKSVLPAKQKREKQVDYKLKILHLMLNMGPWNRLMLTVRWLQHNYAEEFQSHFITPPDHVKIVVGPVQAQKLPNVRETDGLASQPSHFCTICQRSIDLPEVLFCIDCASAFHCICLAERFISSNSLELVPVEGLCPKCQKCLSWSELIWLKRKNCR